MTTTDAIQGNPANAVRWRQDQAGGHVESHFLKANSPDGRRAVWIKHTLLASSRRAGDTIAETWAIAFDRKRPGGFPIGVKSTVPVARARFGSVPFSIEAAGGRLHATGSALRAEGEGQRQGHHLVWDLSLSPVGPTFWLYPLDLFYRARFPRTKVITPCPDARAQGRIDVDGETWSIDGWPAMQGHNWGPAHTEAYVWSHCNAWDQGAPGVWLEAAAARIPLGPAKPWLGAAAIHVDDHTLRFDGPRALRPSPCDVEHNRWRVGYARRGARLEIELTAEAEATAGLRYDNPDGDWVACLNSKLAHGRVKLQRRGHPDLVLSTEQAALEVATTARDHGVRMLM